MSKIEKERDANKMFLKIVEGSLRQKSYEGHPEARKRDWTVGGESGTTWEISSPAAFGKIVDVTFYEGDSNGRKFTSLNIELDPNEEGKSPVITTGVETKYAQAFLKMLPNIPLDEEVRIRPYSYLKEGDEYNTVGMEILTRDNQDKFTKRVEDFFYDWEKREEKHGYPKPPKSKDEMSSKDWKRYFEDANEYVINYTKENILPKFTVQSKVDSVDALDEVLDEPKDNINPDDIPF